MHIEYKVRNQGQFKQLEDAMNVFCKHVDIGEHTNIFLEVQEEYAEQKRTEGADVRIVPKFYSNQEADMVELGSSLMGREVRFEKYDPRSDRLSLVIEKNRYTLQLKHRKE